MLVVLFSCKHPSSVFLFILSRSFGRMFFTPTRSCLLLIHLPHTPSHYLLLCLPPWFISSSHFLSGRSLTAKTSALLSSYRHCLISFIDQQYCFYCHSLFMFALQDIFHTIFPYVCTISTPLQAICSLLR